MDTLLHVLIVEDDPHVANTIKNLIEYQSSDMVTSTVHKLSQAISTLENGSVVIDVVLLDLGLPDAFDMEALRTLRERWPFLAIVVLTGQGMDRETETIQAGACDYFSKGSFTAEALTRSIRKSWIRRKAMEKFAPAHASLESTGRAIEDAKHALEDSGEYIDTKVKSGIINPSKDGDRKNPQKDKEQRRT